MTNKKKIAVLLFLLSIFILYIIIYTIPGVSGVLKKTELINYGELKVSDQITCYFVRNETVYLADRSGDINYYFEEGSQIRRGTKVLDVLNQNKGEPENDYEKIIERLGKNAVKAENNLTTFNGIVSYYVDGYESYFIPEKISKLKYDEVSKLDIKPVNLTRKETFTSEPIYKICNYSSWYIIGWVEDGNVSKYTIGDSVDLILPEGELSAVIENIIEDDDRWLIIMKTDRYYSKFARERKVDATIITENATGIIIRNESITTDDKGVIGVYARKKNGDYEFKPIKVITTDGKNSVVEFSFFYDEDGNEVKTVDVYDEILKNAGN